MWIEIINVFKDMTPLLWASQICGIIAFIIITVSFQLKRIPCLFVGAFSYIFFALESAFAGLYANVIVSLIALVRNAIIVFCLIKKNKEMPNFITWILVGLTWMTEIIYFSLDPVRFTDIANYIPAILVTIYTVAAANKNFYVLKVGALVQEIGFLTYYAIYRLPLSIVREVILFISIVISIIVQISKDVQMKKTISNVDCESENNIVKNLVIEKENLD